MLKTPALFLLSFAVFSTPAIAQKKHAATAPPAPAATATAANEAPPGGLMKPGLWEITTVNETAGSTTKRTVSARACYAAADIANTGRIVPQQREFGMKCETRDARQQGFEVTWRVVCAGKDSTMTGGGKMTTAPQSYSGRAELELKGATGKPVRVEQKVSGAWLGPCK